MEDAARAASEQPHLSRQRETLVVGQACRAILKLCEPLAPPVIPPPRGCERRGRVKQQHAQSEDWTVGHSQALRVRSGGRRAFGSASISRNCCSS